MKNLLLIIAFLSLCLYSCKNDDDLSTIQKPPQESVDSYLQLKPGNYWIYEQYVVEVDGSEEKRSSIDSLYVSQELQINEETYYLLEGTLFNSPINDTIRLEGEQAIILNREKALSTSNLPDTLSIDFDKYPGFFEPVITILKNEQINYSLPIGNVVSDYQKELQFFPVEDQISIEDTRYSTMAYAKDIGLVYSSIFFANSFTIYEMRLARYRVE